MRVGGPYDTNELLEEIAGVLHRGAFAVSVNIVEGIRGGCHCRVTCFGSFSRRFTSRVTVYMTHWILILKCQFDL